MLNEQLDIQMRDFLANPGKGMRVDTRGGFKRIYLSPIFDWFEEDFESSGGVLKFIEPYVAPKYGPHLSYSGWHTSLKERSSQKNQKFLLAQSPVQKMKKKLPTQSTI